MNVTQFIHPEYAGWKEVKVSFSDALSGSCISLSLRDKAENPITINLHFHGKADGEFLLTELKKAFKKLRGVCSNCRQEFPETEFMKEVSHE